MMFLRSLLSVLLLATVLAPTLARADEDDAGKGAMMIEVFAGLCPSVLASGFAEMDIQDEALAEGMGADACACIDTRLRAMPPADVPRMMRGREGNDFKQLANRCVSLAMKPRVGALCGEFVRGNASVDAAAAAKACTCAQERSDAISDDAFVAGLDGNGGGLEALLAACEPDTTPVPPKDPAP